MQKIIFLHNLLVVALVVGVVGIPASIHSQQTYALDSTRFFAHLSEIGANTSPKNLAGPPKAVARPHTEPGSSPVGQLASRKKAGPHAPFEHIIKQAATTHQVDADLIKAIIMAESRYNPKAVSKRGARGLMQLMPVTAKSLGVEDSFDPEDNINGGVMYFRKLLDRFDGNVEFALAAYNAGSRNVRKYGGVPPFRQTRTYIHKVFKYHRQYRGDVAKSGKMA
jgi:soluble lytic murein transglycosylase-like protein